MTAPDISPEAVDVLSPEAVDRMCKLLGEDNALTRMIRGLQSSLTARDELLREHRRYFIAMGERNSEWVDDIDKVLT